MSWPYIVLAVAIVVLVFNVAVVFLLGHGRADLDPHERPHR